MAGDHLERVREMITRGDVEGVARSLISSIKSNSRDIEAWLLLAEIMDAPAKKRDCYQQVLKYSPGNPVALKGLEKVTAESASQKAELPRQEEASSTARPTAKISTDNELFQTLNQKETDELIQIWKDNDRSQWSDTVFEIIQDILRARIGNLPSQKQTSFFSERSTPFRVMRLGVFGILFLALGIIATIAFLFFSHTQLTWRNLGTPPEKVVKILDGDNNSVRVQTESGVTYYCQFKETKECWVKSTKPPEYGSVQPYEKTTPFRTYREPPALSGVVETLKLFSQFGEYDQVFTIYARTEKGKIYVWQEESGNPFEGIIFYCTMPISALFGLVFWVWFEARLRPSPKKKDLAIENGQVTFQQKVQFLSKKAQSEQVPAPFPMLRHPLFGFAWLLFLVCMFMPQYGKGSPIPEYAFTEYGFHAAWGGIANIPAILITFIYSLITLDLMHLFLSPLSNTVVMSVLLFIASPFMLAWSNSSPKGMRVARLVYALLNLVCVILFLSIIFTTPIASHIDPNDLDFRVLPGFFIWTCAQITLTIAVFTKSWLSGM
jgi:hypothetical protein